MTSSREADMGNAPTLYGAGFNAHQQLSANTKNDLKSFEVIYEAKNSNCRVLFAEWSTVVLVDGNRIVSRGFQQIDDNLEDAAQNLTSAIGDHDGLKACVDTEGNLYLVKGEANGKQSLVRKGNESSPRIARLARASNGRIAMIAKQAPNGNLCHLTEFESLENFQKWYQDPVGDGTYSIGHHMLPGRPKSLVANTANFVLLMESGCVWTWGDSRYRSLGRSISGEGAVHSSVPGEVQAVGGLKVVSIAAGGWQAAALSEDGALYVWGAASPGSDSGVKFLEPDEVNLVNITGGNDDEPLDITGVSIGSDHIAVVAENGQLYAAGNNSNGQLGIAFGEEFVEDFQMVEELAGTSPWLG
ncbi:Putative regulator of chromosome condensation 1/beta-lactamase-inhibitor protein II [Septoria linicola]|uniref:Regulator of chromosome condensation 1/beta-lactamase-inhibitor protein II n=1 Tax=Septoria linicola TaxID=215465 RepID=A0A9Q9AMI8_9PEZI|nr:Putative regulator of chromosome condensation 1/beta-lactamase-inhibitor protein II [Septoria linicola]